MSSIPPGRMRYPPHGTVFQHGQLYAGGIGPVMADPLESLEGYDFDEFCAPNSLTDITTQGFGVYSSIDSMIDPDLPSDSSGPSYYTVQKKPTTTTSTYASGLPHMSARSEVLSDYTRISQSTPGTTQFSLGSQPDTALSPAWQPWTHGHTSQNAAWTSGTTSSSVDISCADTYGVSSPVSAKRQQNDLSPLGTSGRGEGKKPRLDDGECMTVPNEIVQILHTFLRRCNNVFPTDRKIRSLADVTDLSLDHVEAWLEQHLARASNPDRQAFTHQEHGVVEAWQQMLPSQPSLASEVPSATGAVQHIPDRHNMIPHPDVAYSSAAAPPLLSNAVASPELLTDFPLNDPLQDWASHAELEAVRRYIDDRRKEHSASGQVKSSEENPGPLKCTQGCHYSTENRNAWERHEQQTLPQNIWSCTRCRPTEVNPNAKRCIHHRKDKVLTHIKETHLNTYSNDIAEQLRNKKAAEQMRDESFVPSRAEFESGCAVSGCGVTFLTWKARNDHIISSGHFEQKRSQSRKPRGDRLPTHLDHESNFDEDSDPDRRGDVHRSAASTLNSAQRSGNVAKSKSVKEPNGNKDKTKESDTTNSNNSRTVSTSQRSDDAHWMHCAFCPRRLVDVEKLCIAAEPTHKPRYAALESFRSSPTALLPLTLPYDVTSLRKPGALAETSTSGTFRDALNLTRVLGLRYLWVDALCIFQGDPDDERFERRNVVNRIGNATVLLNVADLAVGPHATTSRLLRFVCEPSKKYGVRAWVQQELLVHQVRNLGLGAYGIVDKVRLDASKVCLARKTVFSANIRGRTKQQVLNEIGIMQKLEHPHIVRFKAAYHDKDSVNILMSPVADYDLKQYLEGPDRLPAARQELERWFGCLASALSYMHAKQIKHKDIKPANILISSLSVYLSDFGTSVDFSTSSPITSGLGSSADFSISASMSSGSTLLTPRYCAPEVAAHSCRGRSADVFSLGCVFAEMLTVLLGKEVSDMHRFIGIGDENDRSDTYHHHQHLDRLLRWLATLKELTINSLQRSVVNMCGRMLSRDPLKRPTAKDVLDNLCLGTGGLSSDCQNCMCHSRIMDLEGKHVDECGAPEILGRDLEIQSGSLPQSVTCPGDANLKPATAMLERKWTVSPLDCSIDLDEGRREPATPLTGLPKIELAASLQKVIPRDPPLGKDARNMKQVASILNELTGIIFHNQGDQGTNGSKSMYNDAVIPPRLAHNSMSQYEVDWTPLCLISASQPQVCAAQMLVQQWLSGGCEDRELPSLMEKLVSPTAANLIPSTPRDYSFTQLKSSRDLADRFKCFGGESDIDSVNEVLSLGDSFATEHRPVSRRSTTCRTRVGPYQDCDLHTDRSTLLIDVFKKPWANLRKVRSASRGQRKRLISKFHS